MLGTIRCHWPLIAYGKASMLHTLSPEVLNVSADEGGVLFDEPGLALTLDIEATQALPDQLLSRCALVRKQQRTVISQAPPPGHPRRGEALAT
jgi:hypothetical protein